MQSLDLFAGPGGWDEGLRPLGIEPLGVEWDDAACATRRAAGHPTLQADVAGLDPLDYAGTELLLASPPCPAFSAAGKGRNSCDTALILDIMTGLECGLDRRAEFAPQAHDPRAMLVVEPLRFALALRPRLIAFEQVPPALPFWERTAEILRAAGYFTWTGVLGAERFGVAQTRRRAILIASLDGPVTPPAPTHRPYKKGEEPGITEPGLLPWRSMYDALGWGATHRPYYTLAGGTAGGPCYDFLGGSAPRRTLLTERAEGRWVKGPRENLEERIVRLTFSEAGVLQSFPAEYLWTGTRTAQAVQVGNAVPPLMARAIVGSLVGARITEETS